MRHADAADYEDGNLSAARPNELQRRGVTVAGDPLKARACYIKARELMDAAVAFYLSPLPSGSPGGREEKC